MGRETKPEKKRLTAEALGTFALVFFGTGAVIVHQTHEGVIGHAGIALTFGLVVMAMVFTFGAVSGAHLNPAVTLGFAAAGRFPARLVPGYVVSQVLGALSASLLLRFLFPESRTLGASLPSGSEGQSFLLELVLTAVLMLVILHVTAAGNLNISRYISTAVGEAEIDLAETNAALVEIEDAVQTATSKHNHFLRELGLPPLPNSYDKDVEADVTARSATPRATTRSEFR